jgi:hypothetical protein
MAVILHVRPRRAETEEDRKDDKVHSTAIKKAIKPQQVL